MSVASEISRNGRFESHRQILIVSAQVRSAVHVSSSLPVRVPSAWREEISASNQTMLAVLSVIHAWRVHAYWSPNDIV